MKGEVVDDARERAVFRWLVVVTCAVFWGLIIVFSMPIVVGVARYLIGKGH